MSDPDTRPMARITDALCALAAAGERGSRIAIVGEADEPTFQAIRSYTEATGTHTEARLAIPGLAVQVRLAGAAPERDQPQVSSPQDLQDLAYWVLLADSDPADRCAHMTPAMVVLRTSAVALAKATVQGLPAAEAVRAPAEAELALHNLLAVVFRDGERTSMFSTLRVAVEEAIRVVAEGNAAREQIAAATPEIEATHDALRIAFRFFGYSDDDMEMVDDVAEDMRKAVDLARRDSAAVANDLLERDRERRALQAEIAVLRAAMPLAPPKPATTPLADALDEHEPVGEP